MVDDPILSARLPMRTGALISHWARRVCLATTIIIVGGVSLAALLGFKTMVVTSGSMAPLFGSGDAVIVRVGPADRVQVGDVITFRTPAGESMTTHRVVGIRAVDGQRWFMTKGDANATADADLTPQDAVYGTEVLALPRMGRFVSFVVSPGGKLALLAFPIAYLMMQESRTVLALRRRRRHRVALVQEPGDQMGGGPQSGSPGPRQPNDHEI